MNIKRFALLALLAFVVYYVLRSPDSAATALRVVGQASLDGVRFVAEALARFIDTLFA